jgi:uncharacterized protein (DUF305 family)
MPIRPLLLALLISAPAVALAQHAPSAGGQAAANAYAEANTRMMEGMHALQPTGDSDRDFVMMMIPHHQGAIDMARIQLQYGNDPELRAMAEKIIADQEREIAEMKDWQAKNGG